MEDQSVENCRLFRAIYGKSTMQMWAALREKPVEGRPAMVVELAKKYVLPHLRYGNDQGRSEILNQIIQAISAAITDMCPEEGVDHYQFNLLLVELMAGCGDVGISYDSATLDLVVWKSLLKSWCTTAEEGVARNILDLFVVGLRNIPSETWGELTKALRAFDEKSSAARLGLGVMTFSLLVEESNDPEGARRFVNTMASAWLRQMSTSRMFYLARCDEGADELQCADEALAGKRHRKCIAFAEACVSFLNRERSLFSWRWAWSGTNVTILGESQEEVQCSSEASTVKDLLCQARLKTNSAEIGAKVYLTMTSSSGSTNEMICS